MPDSTPCRKPVKPHPAYPLTPQAAMDLAGKMVVWPRPKTGTPRRCPLWSETVGALAVYLENRPRPRRLADTNIVFLNRLGQRWVDQRGRCTVQNPFARLCTKAGIYRTGLGFYHLRHVFRTVAEVASRGNAIEPRCRAQQQLAVGHGR